MIDVAVGIDIGTSYTKAIARTDDGTVVAICRVRSPQFRTDSCRLLADAAEWWTCFKDVLRHLLTANMPQQLHVVSICVSAIAPTLTVFDAVREHRAYAILYLSLPEKDGGTISQSDPKLTQQRLKALRSVAHKERFACPCISDLVGYINWRLTGSLTINSVSLAETGVVGGNCDKFAIADNVAPQLVTPCEQIGQIASASATEIGIQIGVPVCGGCPDTVNSVVGAGLTQTSDTMLYLGTFGSVMRLEVNVNTLLNAAVCPSPPYRWLLSIPHLGSEIESLGNRWFGSVGEVIGLYKLDREAIQAPAGADGTLFLVPRWKSWMMPAGVYKFVANRNGEFGNCQTQARAVLESIAYAVLALGIDVGKVIKAGGGGARSKAWLNILSVVLNRDIQARYLAWEATGAADIAAKLVWQDMAAVRPYYTSHRLVDMSRAVIDDNLERVKEAYYELDWL